MFARSNARSLPANLLAQSLAIAIELLQGGLRLAALRIHPQHLIDLRRIVAPTRGQPAFHKVGLFANEPDIEHGKRNRTGLTGFTRLKPIQSRKSCQSCLKILRGLNMTIAR